MSKLAPSILTTSRLVDLQVIISQIDPDTDHPYAARGKLWQSVPKWVDSLKYYADDPSNLGNNEAYIQLIVEGLIRQIYGLEMTIGASLMASCVNALRSDVGAAEAILRYLLRNRGIVALQVCINEAIYNSGQEPRDPYTEMLATLAYIIIEQDDVEFLFRHGLDYEKYYN